MLSVSYFCIATEYKFLSEANASEIIVDYLHLSELFHSRAIEVSFCYLPATSPIIKHYINTYYKHYHSSLETIKEDFIIDYRIDIIKSYSFNSSSDFASNFIKKKKLNEKVVEKPLKSIIKDSSLSSLTRNASNSKSKDKKLISNSQNKNFIISNKGIS